MAASTTKARTSSRKEKMEKGRMVKERGMAFLLTRAHCVVAGVIEVVNAQ